MLNKIKKNLTPGRHKTTKHAGHYKARGKKKGNWHLLLIIVILLILILSNSILRYYHADELEAIHTAWKISQGEKIYVDFFQHHHPLYYYLIIPVLYIFGETVTAITALRLLTFIVVLGILLITWLIAEKLFNDSVARLSLVLLASTFIFAERIIEIRPDVIMAFLLCLSFLFLLCFYDRGDKKYLAANAFVLGLAFLILQKAIFFIFFTVLILIYDYIKNKIKLKEGLIWVNIFLFTLLPYYAYLFLSGQFYTYVKFNWLINILFLKHTSVLGAFISLFYFNNPLIWLYVAGIVLIYKKNIINKKTAFLSLGLVLSIFLFRAQDARYLLPSLPFIAIISAYALDKIYENNTALYYIFLLFTTSLTIFMLIIYITVRSNFNNAAKINYVLSQTNLSDYIYDGQPWFNLYRKDLDYFWYSLSPDGGLRTHQTYLGDYDYNIYKLIDKYKPKIISNYKIENMDDKSISNYYQQSDLFPDLYIRKN